MTRIKQFANDMGLSYNQAKNLVNKGRKKRDGGSTILEKTMGAVKAKKGKSMKLPKKKPKNFKKIVEDQRVARGEITIGDLNEANTNPKDFMPDKMLEKQEGGGTASEDYFRDSPESSMPRLSVKEMDKFIKQMQKQSKGPVKKEKKPSPSKKKQSALIQVSKSRGGGFGMLSVKAGIDNNPKPTQADRIAGATMKDKKEVKKMGGGMYDMTPRRMNKGGVARGMGAAVKGTGFKGVY